MLTQRVWSQICQHIDGICVGSTVAALLERGALELIAAGPAAAIAPLGERLGANPGYFQVAVRLLADQGWVTGTGEPGAADQAVAATAPGREILTELAVHYREVPRLLRVAAQTGAMMSGRADPAPLRRAVELMAAEWRVPLRTRSARARVQVLAHLDGHLAAPVMCWLSRHRPLAADQPTPLDNEALRAAFLALGRLGWARVADGAGVLTPAGRVALALAPQYWHPVSYLPTFRAAPDLLFGSPSRAWAQLAGQSEDHLDRSLDVEFSGKVFSGTCREAFLDVVLPLFDTAPLAAQPRAVVDIGCGDGSLLEALYCEVRSRTVRGERLADAPLLMIGAEPSPAARGLAAARLSAAGVPHALTEGDITEPDGVAGALLALGIDPAGALYVNKSVLHDRTYDAARAGKFPPPDGPPPRSGAAYATPDGRLLSPAEVAGDLAAVLRSWRDLARRHGMVVVEGHTVDSAVTAGLIGRSVGTDLDATHGYSCQYPVEAGVLAWAARTAGYRSRQHREPLADRLGYASMTIDHFTVDQ